MPAAAALIPAAIGAVGSIAGGVMGSSAASNAARIQSQAAQAQAAEFQKMLAQYNPAIGTAGTAAASAVNDATATGQAGLTQAGAGVGSAVQGAQSLLNPYITGGAQAQTTLASLMAPGGSLTQPFTASMMEANDPGYAFRIAQANKALQGSAAARGGALSGATAGALQGQSQNLASSEFANAQQRYVQGQQMLYNMLSGQANQGVNAATTAGGYGMTGAQLGTNLAEYGANFGQTGATTAGQFTTNAAQQQAANAISTQQAIANMMMGGANAQAAGTMGAANAWSGALGGVANAAGQAGGYFQQQNLLNWLKQNPGALGGGGGTFIV